jgi:hypothetical protein
MDVFFASSFPPFSWQGLFAPTIVFPVVLALAPVGGVLLVQLGVRRIERWRNRRRAALLRRGLCLKCGYDLRASGERCPECGAPRPQYGSRERAIVDQS